jgi:hypothetical protein
MRGLTVKKIKKRRHGKKTKITAVVIKNTAAAIKSDCRQTIRHIPLIHEVILKGTVSRDF